MTLPAWAPSDTGEWGTAVRELIAAAGSPHVDVLGAHLATLPDNLTKRREIKKAWSRATVALLGPGVDGFVLDAVAAFAEAGGISQPMAGTQNRDLAIAFVAAAGAGRIAGAAPVLLRLARRAASIPGTGRMTRDDGIAAAAFYALADLDSPEGLDALCELRRDLDYVILNERVTEVLRQAAEALGVAEDDWLERAIPAWGLGPDAVGTIGPSGEGTIYGNAPYRAEIAVVDFRTVTLTWRDDDGLVATTRHPFPSPTGFKRRFGSHHTESTQRAAKRVLAELAAERRRLSRLSPTKSWKYDEWSRLYLSHPITGTVARAAIWEFTDADGRLVPAVPSTEGEFAALTAPPVEPVAVRLWNGAGTGTDERERWRKYLAGAGIETALGQLG
ncbi:DUF4132 domain-containing protein [Phytomonospora sp. NPDC050363]|uniref:DUF4132 domain-containing protein n=1 Tax=Phytomonospora sp. NPDC050363 TaxID=3155642 RepID=UPI0033D8AEA1